MLRSRSALTCPEGAASPAYNPSYIAPCRERKRERERGVQEQEEEGWAPQRFPLNYIKNVLSRSFASSGRRERETERRALCLRVRIKDGSLKCER